MKREKAEVVTKILMAGHDDLAYALVFDEIPWERSATTVEASGKFDVTKNISKNFIDIERMTKKDVFKKDGLSQGLAFLISKSDKPSFIKDHTQRLTRTVDLKKLDRALKDDLLDIWRAAGHEDAGFSLLRDVKKLFNRMSIKLLPVSGRTADGWKVVTNPSYEAVSEKANVLYEQEQKETLENRETEQIGMIEAEHVDKKWLKKALESQNFEGPNGNKVIAYVWSWVWGSKEKVTRDGDVEIVDAKVSDWDNAETCRTCGRPIVHSFFVWHKDTDTVSPYGFDHVHKALGISKELRKSAIQKIIDNVSTPPGQRDYTLAEKKRVADVLMLYKDTAAPTLAELEKNIQKRLRERYNFSNIQLVYNTKDKKYAYMLPGYVTQATINKIEKLMPDFELVSSEDAQKIRMGEKAERWTLDLARANTREALDALHKTQHSPYTGDPNRIWAANINDGLIMRIVDGSIWAKASFDPLDYDSVKEWTIGGADLARLFRTATRGW